MKSMIALSGWLLRLRCTWAVVGLSFLWFAGTTWLWPLLLPDEGRYVGVAWNMLTGGSVGVPLLDGLPFFHKPPLFYWLTALSLKLLGPSVWAARMASVLGACLMVGMLFWFLKARGQVKLAAMAGVVLATMPLVFGAAHYANLDMLVAGLITATILLAAQAALRLEQQQSYRVLLMMAYVALAAGFMAKGLIGVVLPCGVIVIWLLARGQWRVLLRLLWWPGPVVFAVLALPWMIAMQLRYPGFFDYYILYQHFYRFLEKGFNNARPVWFYIPVLVLLALPWSLKLRQLFSRAYGCDRLRLGPIHGLMLLWFLLILVFFSIPNSKLIGYVLPCAPPMAFFAADLFLRRFQGNEHVHGRVGTSKARRYFAVYLAAAVSICLVAVLALTFSGQPSSKPLAQQIAKEYQAGDQVVMLGRIYYDVDFYLRSGQPAWVVAHWDDPGISQTDNWQKELFDAAKFDPDEGRRLLVTYNNFPRRMCAWQGEVLWLIGRPSALESWSALRVHEPDLRAGKLQAWRLTRSDRLAFCADMSVSGGQ